MKNLLKTALCLLLCALLSLLPSRRKGKKMEERTCGDYTYVLLEDGGARITDYEGEDAELSIPDELDGHPVREIGEEAFYWCDFLTTITLPDALTSIGDNAFLRLLLPDHRHAAGQPALHRQSRLRRLRLVDRHHAAGQLDFHWCKPVPWLFFAGED